MIRMCDIEYYSLFLQKKKEKRKQKDKDVKPEEDKVDKMIMVGQSYANAILRFLKTADGKTKKKSTLCY